MVKELVQDKIVERLNETKAKGSVKNDSTEFCKGKIHTF